MFFVSSLVNELLDKHQYRQLFKAQLGSNKVYDNQMTLTPCVQLQKERPTAIV